MYPLSPPVSYLTTQPTTVTPSTQTVANTPCTNAATNVKHDILKADRQAWWGGEKGFAAAATHGQFGTMCECRDI